MSVIKIKGSSANTGDFTIQPPNGATDRTLTLPDANGNIVSTGDSGTVATAMIANANITAAKLDSAQTGTAPIFGVRAWVHFDCLASPLLVTGSGNVSSVSDNGTGRLMVNFATALPTEHYTALCIAQDKDGNDDRNFPSAHECKWTGRNRSTSQFPLDIGDWMIGGYSGTLQDGDRVSFLAIC